MQLSTTKSNAFANMLISFAGGTLEKFSQEATNRTIFVTNVMKALSEIEINDETSESVDILMDLILSYDISIFDLYAFCGTSEVSIEKLTTFFANYKDYFNNRKSQLLEKIYLSITSDTIANNENSAVLDVIHKTIYQFFDVCDDEEEVPMSDKDKLLLEVNKAICNNLKMLEQKSKTNFERKAGVVISQLRADRDRLAAVIEKIKAEIENSRNVENIPYDL